MKTKIRGALVWFIVTLYTMYSFCLNTAGAVFSEAIQTTFNATSFDISIAYGAFITGFACMQIPAGYMLDKFNARYIVSAGVLLMVLGNIMISSSSTMPMFVTSNFFLGLGAAFAFISAAVLISQWFEDRFFPILFGLTQAVSCISAGILHYYFTVLLQTHSWHEIYLGLAKFGIVLLILVLSFVKSSHKLKPKASFLKSIRSVFKNKQLVLCSIAAACSFGVLLAYASLWYLKVQEYYSVAKLDSVAISGIIFVGFGTGTPLLGWYSNLVKSRVMVIHTTIVLGVMALILGLYWPHFNSDNLIVMKFISFFIGFFMSGATLFYTVVSENADDSNRGVAVSILNTSVFLFNSALLFIPYLFITKYSQDFFTHLWVLVFFPMISILLVYFIKDTHPHGKY